MYLPAAAIGNSLSLATFGPAGELMGFFSPSIDFAQNVREGMFAVWSARDSRNKLEWCFSHNWKRHQTLKPQTNILVTELTHRRTSLKIRVTDVLPPGERAVVRHFEIDRDDPDRRVVFYQYLNLALADMDRRNAVHYMPDDKVVVQQFRDTVVAATASSPFSVSCGIAVSQGESNVKKGMRFGSLQGGDQCMGDVDFAVGIELGPEHHQEITFVLAASSERSAAIDSAVRLSQTSSGSLQDAARDRCASILTQAGACPVEQYREAYERAVLSLMDLYDERSGTFIAAPEFDAHFSLSGGYGYCWPRDAAVSSLVAAELGFGRHVERFFDWCMATQLDDGHWFQRYWTNGVEAPSWCVRDNEIQLDQTCAVLHAAGVYARTLGDEKAAFVDRFRSVAERAAGAIVKHLTDTGLHKRAADLWECCHGSFAYTNGAVIAALREGRDVFGIAAPDLDRLRRVLIETFFKPDKGRWARRIDPEGNLDETGDSSVLGLIEPWEVFDLADPADRELATTTLKFVTDTLLVDVRGGKAVLRFENESYMGGGPGCVNTLWLAQCRLKLASFLSGKDRDRQIKQARRLIKTALAHTNPVGQLPELIPNVKGIAYWAAPHGWASSLLIQCVHLLGRLPQSQPDDKTPLPEGH